jgi:hypothetical protein
MRRRRTINKMRGGAKGDMIELYPNELLEIKADISLHPEIINNIKEKMGIEHNPELETFSIHEIPKTDKTLFISLRSYPDTYNKLLDIYKSGRTVIKASHTKTTPRTILNNGEPTFYANPEDSNRPSSSWFRP